MNIFEYSLSLYFFFYLICHASILDLPRKAILNKLHFILVYIANCAFCFSFWASCLVVAVIQLPNWFILAAPVINLLIDSLYRGLNSTANQENNINLQ